MSARKLLAINNYFYMRGGAEAVFFEHMQLFSNAEWQSVPFSMHHPKNISSQWDEYFVEVIEYGMPQSQLTKLKQAAKVIYSNEAKQKIRALIEKTRPDIAHAHNVYHHISPSIFPELKRNHIPVVMTAHDLKLLCPAYTMLSHGKLCESCKNGRIYNVAAKKCIKNSRLLSGLIWAETAFHQKFGLYRNYLDKIITPSLFYYNKFIEWGWPEEQLEYIANSIDPAFYVPAERHDDYYLYAGRLSHEKGLIELIKAIANTGDRLVIAGTGPLESELKLLANQLDAKVNFTGFLQPENLRQKIAAAKALVLPSKWYENAPISVLEAYASGIPVLASNIGGLTELVRDEETGLLFEADNQQSIEEALIRFAAMGDQKQREMGEQGREWVLQDFTPERYYENMLCLYRTVGGI